jgi:hypothetical protein
MADIGPQLDDSTQSFVVRTWQESPGNLRGTIRHVQSQARHSFTQLSQTQEFIEQNWARSSNVAIAAAKSATARPIKFTGLHRHRRRVLMAASALVIVLAATLTVIASINLPMAAILGGAVGPSLSIEVILALFIGLALGSLGSAIWLRRNK